MSNGARLNGWITRIAVGRHLPQRAVRARLTLLYGGLFLASGAALMAIAYLLLINAGFVFTIGGGAAAPPNAGDALPQTGSTVSLLAAGGSTHPSAATMAHWRAVAVCMREEGVAEFPNPVTKVPANLGVAGSAGARLRELNDRDGALILIPLTVDTQSPAFVTAATSCGFLPNDNPQRTHVRVELLIQSSIALTVMSLISLALGWLMAGRVLQPLEDSFEAQRQFVANASHELRAPLTRQRALVQVALADPEADAESLRAAHERVLASEQQLEVLIDGLLALARSQTGLERREHVELAALTSRLIQARGSQPGDPPVQISSELAAAPISGDPRLAERLLANLIDNAIRHNVPDGWVAITTGTHDRESFVSVSNSGPMIPPGQLERLFEPFARLGIARTDHDGGHGLGLSIVKAVADAHGARVTSDNAPEGGLTISVAFPVATGVEGRAQVLRNRFTTT